MQILVVCAYFWPRSNAPAARLMCFSHELSRQHSVEVFTADEGPAHPDVRIERHRRFAQSNLDGLFRRTIKDFGFGLLCSSRFMKNRPDVVIVSSPVFLTAVLTVFTARLYKVPVVLDVRDPYPEVLSATGSVAKQGFVYKILELLARSMYQSASVVVTVTEGFSELIHKIAPSIVSTMVVENGYPQKIATLSNSIKLEYFTVVIHGTLGWLQDVSMLVEVAERLKEHGVHVLVIGKGSAQGLLTKAPKNLRFTGEIPFDDAMELVAQAHVGLSLRNKEEVSARAIPVKIYEYIGLGLPVVVSPKSDAGDFVKTLGVGFECNSIDRVVSVILSLRNDPSLYRRAVDACKVVRPNYTREVHASRFRCIVEAVGSRTRLG